MMLFRKKTLPTTVVTMRDVLQAVSALAGRGTVEETFIIIKVRVPFYRAHCIRTELRARLPFYVGLDVRHLSLRQHFTLWGVRELP